MKSRNGSTNDEITGFFGLHGASMCFPLSHGSDPLMFRIRNGVYSPPMGESPDPGSLDNFWPLRQKHHSWTDRLTGKSPITAVRVT
jgi:hypothetical protein